jgi:regulator of protease activity HflC (stomatin/prohibitin superfamily)
MIADGILNALSVLVRWIPIRLAIVHSYEQGVRWWCGKDTALLTRPGVYFHIAWFGDITVDGIRPKEVETETQCITTSDRRARSFSVGCQYEIEDLRKNQTCVDEFEPSLLNLIERIAAKVMRSTDEKEPDRAILTQVRTQAEKWGVKIRYLGLLNDAVSRPMHHFGVSTTIGGSDES